jgi:hypothetical protein
MQGEETFVKTRRVVNDSRTLRAAIFFSTENHIAKGVIG